MNDNEFISFEDRVYANPTTSRDEQVDFIETLRETMGNNLNQINQGTYNLGSQLPSNLGGLSGAEETFEARYQRPQVETTAAQLRSTAQASALNTALSNLQNVYKKRYNDAVQRYQRRAATPSTTGGGNGDDGLPITTNNGSTLGQNSVRLNEAAQQAYNQLNKAQLDEAMLEATNERQSGNFTTANTDVFMYRINGQPYYATLYKDSLGRITGLKTNDANYNASGAQSFIRQLGKEGNLFSNQGKTISPSDLGSW